MSQRALASKNGPRIVQGRGSTAKNGVGSGITAPGSGSQAVESWDQHYSKGITDPVFRHNNKDHKILKCALIGGTRQHFSNQLYFCC